MSFLPPIASGVATALAFIAEHYDVIEEVADALFAGASKDALRTAVREVKRQAMIAASDAVMRTELKDPPDQG